MASWSWALVGCHTRAYGGRELAGAYGRSLTCRLDAAWSASFSLDGRSEEAAEIVPLATDLMVWCDGQPVFRGRIGPAQDAIGASRHAVTFTAIDYRGLLDRRVAPPSGLAYTATDQTTIARSIVAYTQALPGGGWGVTNGAASAPAQARDKTLDPGKPLGEAISELFRLDNGGEWGIDADLKLNTWTLRGVDAGVVVDYGGVLTDVNMQQGTDFANGALVTGGQDADGNDLAAVYEASPDVGTDPRGLWQRSQGYPSISTQATLDARAVWDLAQSSVLRPKIAVSFARGRWGGFGHVGLGDRVKLAVRSGWRQIAAKHRVVELAVGLDGKGGEKVTAGLEAT